MYKSIIIFAHRIFDILGQCTLGRRPKIVPLKKVPLKIVPVTNYHFTGIKTKQCFVYVRLSYYYMFYYF